MPVWQRRLPRGDRQWRRRGGPAARRRSRGRRQPRRRGDLVRAGSVPALHEVRDAGRMIGEVLASAVSLLNPSVIVIGGSLSLAGDPLLAGVREIVYRRSLPLATANLRIVQAWAASRRHHRRRLPRHRRRPRPRRRRPLRRLTPDALAALGAEGQAVGGHEAVAAARDPDLQAADVARAVVAGAHQVEVDLRPRPARLVDGALAELPPGRRRRCPPATSLRTAPRAGG